MKKLIVFLLVLLFSLTAVQGYTTLREFDDRCFADGSFTFSIENDKEDPVFTKDIKIQGLNQKTREEFIPNGTWTREVVFYNESTPKQQRSTFVSNPGEIIRPGDYYFFATYLGCRDTPCRISFDLENCKGLIEECYTPPIAVLGCVNNLVDSKAYVRFTGVTNPYLFKNERVGKTLKYYFNSSKRDLWENQTIPGEQLEQINQNTYEVSFPLVEGERIHDVAVINRNCDSYYIQRQRFTCTNGQLPALQPLVDLEPELDVPLDKIEQGEPAPVIPEPTITPPVPEPVIEPEPTPVVKEQPEPTPPPVEIFYEELPEEPAPTGLEDITGNIVAEGEEEGISTSIIILVAVIVVGIFVLVFLNFTGRKQKPPEEEEFDKSFGFGDDAP